MSKAEKTYEGPRFLIGVGLGCLGFIALMFLGTWLFAQLTTPYFKARQQQKAPGVTSPSKR